METMMPRDVRYFCLTHGPFIVSCDVRPGRMAPKRARCPVCKRLVLRVHRRKPGGVAVSVRGETYERLKAESTRRGVPMKKLIEEYTRDIK